MRGKTKTDKPETAPFQQQMNLTKTKERRTKGSYRQFDDRSGAVSVCVVLI